jgi:4-hydroxy-3-methylbut-2-enyl diphosphate reductase
MKLYMANPRGFCAGVDRAIDIVEKGLELYGAPLYVRHEIVHNKTVCDRLRTIGARFVDELSEVPDGGRVIFSAHGVSREVISEAKARGLKTIDATCPLVTKVHMEARILEKRGYRLILIGHKGHPEVIGTMGQVDSDMILMGSAEDVASLDWPEDLPVAYLTQTTLSVDETRDVIRALKERFPDIRGPLKEDVCYATTNRQQSVKDILDKIDILLILGSFNSSNSKRLSELGEKNKLPSYLIENWRQIDPLWRENVENVGISSGASAPEMLVQEVISFLKDKYAAVVQEGFQRAPEAVEFSLPKELKSPSC